MEDYVKKGIKVILGVIGTILLLFVVDLICIFAINRPLFAIKKDNGSIYRGILYDTYNCTEYSVPQIKAKWTKYACPMYEENDDDDEYTFLGYISEAYPTYLIIEPFDDIVRKSADKIHIALDKENGINYGIGEYVKITYDGRIKESYPAQIDAIKIEDTLIDNFEILFHEKNNGKQLVERGTDKKKYSYHVYLVNGDVEIIIGNKKYTLEEALNENKITMEEILLKAIKDFPNIVSYDDGGSIEYHYDNYTILKLNTIAGNRDVYIGNKDFTIHDIEK